jgi:uncharacterized membrane protein
MKMRPNRVLKKLRTGGIVSCFSVHFDGQSSDIASMAGFDCLWTDNEHTARDHAEIREHILTGKRQVQLAQLISLLIGVIIVLLSLAIGHVQGNLLVVPLFVPCFMAMFVRKARATPTFTGTIVSALTAAFISFNQELFGLNISFLWIIPGSFLAGVTISYLLSILR